MGRPRTGLSELLHEFCSNVYFQPPSSKKLTYPCIIYTFDGLNTRHADNRSYTNFDEYSVTYITRDPDDVTKYLLADLPLCELNRSYTSDNLYHYAYRLFW